MALCEQNITDLALNLTYPNDTDLVIFTTAAGVSSVRRWSTIKPIPQKHTEDVAVAGTELEIPSLNGVAFNRLLDIQRSGQSCREIVNATPSGSADIQFVPSSGGDDAKVVVSSDNPLGVGEWIKAIWI